MPSIRLLRADYACLRMKTLGPLRAPKVRLSCFLNFPFYILTIWSLGILITSRAGAVDYFAYGDLRGHVAPCGCDPATDLGGLERLGAFIDIEHGQFPEAKIFDLGNWLTPAALDSSAKRRYITQAMLRMRPDAVLLNRYELRDLAKGMSSIYPKGPWVLSNAKSAAKAKMPGAVEFRRFAGLVVLGYSYDPQFAQLVEPINPVLLEGWRKVIGQEKPSEAVLLFSGSKEHLVVIEKSGLFSVIIASNQAPDSAEPDPLRDQNLANLDIVEDDRFLAEQVPLAVQGVLRGGKPATVVAPNLDALLRPGVAKCSPSTALGPLGQTCSNDSSSLPKLKRVSWLDKSFSNSKRVADLVAQYDKAEMSEFAKKAQAADVDKSKSNFAGAEKCQTCHPQAFAIWKSSRHARAMETLRIKGKDQHSDCVQCHVVGFGEKGGYVGQKLSSHLADVQCENCHGPSRIHSEKPLAELPPLKPAKQVCVTCHKLPHSSAFEFESYWKKIFHSKEK